MQCTRYQKILWLFVLMLAVCATSAEEANAWNPFKSAVKFVKKAGSAIGAVVGSPFGGFLGAATSPTIRNAEDSAHRVIADFDEKTRARITQIDNVLEKRIDQLDANLERRIVQADQIAKDRIDQIDGVMGKNIDLVSDVLAGSVAQVDAVLSKRIEQLDQVAETRIGNIDVVATKATLTLEASLMRVVGIACVAAFAAFAAWRIYQEILVAGGRSAGIRNVVLNAWKPLALQLPVAVVALVCLYAITMWLPGGSARRSTQFVAAYRTALENNIKAFDLTRARYMSAQLQAIYPTDSDARALALKVDLMRDILTRPTLLKSVGGLFDIIQRLELTSSYKDDDPDILTLKGYVSWQAGAKRQDEYEAACLCARALEIAPTPSAFALQPLARNYLEAFLHDPITTDASTTTSVPAYSIAQLQTVLANSPPIVGHEDSYAPFAHIIVYDAMVRDLDKTSTAEYVTMILQHARLKKKATELATLPEAERAGEKGAPIRAEIEAARQARTAAATNVVAAWDDFEDRVRNDPWLMGTSAPLASFMLNDAVYTRAKWFVIENGAADEIADISLAKGVTPETAPPRVDLCQLYTTTLSQETRVLVDYEEAKRFEKFFTQLYAFEKSVIEFKMLDPNLDQPTYKKNAIAAANAAAEVGFYVDDPSGRRPYANVLLDEMVGHLTLQMRAQYEKEQPNQEKSESANDQEAVRNQLDSRRLKLL